MLTIFAASKRNKKNKTLFARPLQVRFCQITYFRRPYKITSCRWWVFLQKATIKQQRGFILGCAGRPRGSASNLADTL